MMDFIGHRFFLNNIYARYLHFIFFQAHGDLVAAVDFDDKILVTGHEDSTVGIWDNRVRKKNEDPIPHRYLNSVLHP